MGEGSEGRLTLGEVYTQVLAVLEGSHGSAEGRELALVLLREVTGWGRHELWTKGEQDICGEQIEQVLMLAQRCRDGEPIQYVCGHWGFYGLDFRVGPGVLIPRPDTEILVETALELLRGMEGQKSGRVTDKPMPAATEQGREKPKENPTETQEAYSDRTLEPVDGAERSVPVVLDLCAGSGCVGIAIGVTLGRGAVYAVEKSPEAYVVLEENRKKLHPGLRTVQGDVLTPERLGLPSADMVVCNPPYLSRKEMGELPPLLRKEPEMALYGGTDGLWFYREIIRRYWRLLNPGGWLLFEVGYTQREAVERLLRHNGYRQVDSRKDYGGNDRVVLGRKPEGA